MSNELSIAVVTAALRKILGPSVSAGSVTTRPLDKVNSDDDRLNIFLYHTTLSAAWRNRPLPSGSGASGGSGYPPLPLTLYYLITAYSREDADDAVAHRILGRAMAILHDKPSLTIADLNAGVLEAGLENEVPAPDVMDQIEPVRLTWHPLSLEELSRLWGGFQTALRFSVAYEVSVILIDSSRPAAAAPPVLQRGRRNEGIPVAANFAPTTPTLESISLPNGQNIAQDGDTLILRGFRFVRAQTDVVRLLFDHPRLSAPLSLTPANVTENEATFVLNAPNNSEWRAGGYMVTLETTTTDPVNGSETRTTNALPLAISARINTPLTLTPDPPLIGSSLEITVNMTPDWHPGQRIRLLYNSIEIEPDHNTLPTTPTGALSFSVPDVSPGKRPVSLRIDGIDSRLIPDRTAHPPQYDPLLVI